MTAMTLLLIAGNKVQADQAVTPVAPTKVLATSSDDDKLSAAELAMTNAYKRVLQLVNRPVQAYVRTENMEVSVFQPGWFHDGASRPDFNTVDIRQTQEFSYAGHKFVSSDLNPGRVFLGQELEFNSMTKYFYTNRTLPKRKLTEAEMIEINGLYRIIGKSEAEIQQIKAPAISETTPTASAAKNDGETETVVPGQSFESIRSIPKQTRVLYGSIAIGTLLVLVILMRVFKRSSD